MGCGACHARTAPLTCPAWHAACAGFRGALPLLPSLEGLPTRCAASQWNVARPGYAPRVHIGAGARERVSRMEDTCFFEWKSLTARHEEGIPETMAHAGCRRNPAGVWRTFTACKFCCFYLTCKKGEPLGEPFFVASHWCGKRPLHRATGGENRR